MRWLLTISGGLAALVLLFPGIVIVGFILFVVPGLILAAMPTVFFYLLAAFVIRKALPVRREGLAYVLALGLAVALASLLVQPFRWQAEASFAKAQEPDVTLPAPLALSGDVLLEELGSPQLGFDPACGALCLAILDQPGVQSFTERAGGRVVTYALRAVDPSESDGPESLEPYEPGQILAMRGGEAGEEAKEALAAAWQQRLAGPERLVRAATPARFDWTLTDDWGPDSGSLTVQRATITDAEGGLRFRRSRVMQSIPTAPPYLAYSADSAGTGFSSRGFELASRAQIAVSPGFAAGDDMLAQALALRDPRTGQPLR